MKLANKIALGITGAGIVLAVTGSMAPVFPFHQWHAPVFTFAYNGLAPVFAPFFGISFLGAAFLFLRALPAFKVSMRRAYAFVIAAIVCSAITFVTPSVSVIFNLRTDPAFTTFTAGVPDLLAVLFLFESMREFSGLIKVKSFVAHWYVAAPLVLAIVVALFFVPYPSWVPHDDVSKGIIGATALLEGFIILSAIIAGRIRGAIGEVYKQSMAWLFAALCVESIECGLSLVYRFIPAGQFNDIFTNLIFQPAILALSLFYLKAGASFMATTEQVAEIHEPLEMVMSAAQLASNPRDIDKILDELRSITAELIKGQAFSPEQESALLHIYLTLENYLTTREPIRNFTREELRRKFDAALLTKLQQLEGHKDAPTQQLQNAMPAAA